MKYCENCSEELNEFECNYKEDGKNVNLCCDCMKGKK